MNICVVTREFPPVTRYTGGIGVHYAALAPELSRLGHRVDVLTVAAEGSTTEIDGVRVVALPRSWSGRFWYLEGLWWTARVAQELRRRGPYDVIFAPEFGGGAAVYSLRKSAGALVTNLVTSTRQVRELGQKASTREGRVQIAIQERLERLQTERSDALVACSNAILRWTAELWDLNRGPAEVVPNFIDLERTRELGSRPLPDWYPKDGPVVLFYGRLELRKGVHVLADAMVETWKERPDANLVLLGGAGEWKQGTMLDRVLEVAGTHAERVHAPGFQPPEALFPAVAAAEVVPFPSLWENFSIAALEARALGAATIVTSGNGFDDFVRDEEDGLFVPPGDSAALAHAIRRLLGDDQLRKRLGAAAAGTANRYTPEAISARFVDLFERVAA